MSPPKEEGSRLGCTPRTAREAQPARGAAVFRSAICDCLSLKVSVSLHAVGRGADGVGRGARRQRRRSSARTFTPTARHRPRPRPRPPPRTKWTRLVPHPVLIGHAAPAPAPPPLPAALRRGAAHPARPTSVARPEAGPSRVPRRARTRRFERWRSRGPSAGGHSWPSARRRRCTGCSRRASLPPPPYCCPYPCPYCTITPCLPSRRPHHRWLPRHGPRAPPPRAAL